MGEEEEEKRVSPQRYTYHTQYSKSWKKCAWIFLQKKNRVKKYFNIIFICCATFYSFSALLWLSDGNRTLVPQKCGHKVT